MSEQEVNLGKTGLVPMGEQGVALKSLDDAYRFAKMVINSGMAPAGFDKPEQVIVSVQTGAELGLPPMTALKWIPVIKGRSAMMVDAQKAIVRRDGGLEPGTDFREWIEGEGDAMVAFCTSRKRGHDEEFRPTTFSMKDAKDARLGGDNWSKYPKRMLQKRATGHHIADHYSEYTLGLMTVDMAEQLPPAPRPERAELPEASTPDPVLEAVRSSGDGEYLEAEPLEPSLEEAAAEAERRPSEMEEPPVGALASDDLFGEAS